MEIAACIDTALSNALRLEEIHSQHIQELRRLQALATPAFAPPPVDDAAISKLRADNVSLLQRLTDQESGIVKLRHQAVVLTKCASRALELLVRSRGSSASTDPEILQLKNQLRKSGVSDANNRDRSEEKRVPRPEAAPSSKTVEGPIHAQPDNFPQPSSQVPPHHAKRRRKETEYTTQNPQVSCAEGVANITSASEVPKSAQDAQSSMNFGSVAKDDVAAATSFPILFDDSKAEPSCDELFDDAEFNRPAQLPVEALKKVTLKPSAVAPVIRLSDAAESLAGPALRPAVSHWMSAQPGDHRMNFATTFATAAASSGCARVAWDATGSVADPALDTRVGHDAAASAKYTVFAHRQSTEPLPPTVEKPQNFIQVVRGGARDKLPGHGCKQCDAFYAALESALPQGQMPTNKCDGNHHAADARAAVANIRENVSRHRAVFRKQDSPEDYWTTKFKD
jgi:hypothetical protein